MKNFWKTLTYPFTILAPMDGVTDAVFRRIVLDIARPDVFFTEFTNIDGLLSSGRNRVEEKLYFDAAEQPIVAQIWGTNPENFKKAARLISEMGFSGIDINMGCPERTVIKMGACSALIKTPDLASKIIEATKTGARGLPVSVKTRIGFGAPSVFEWIAFLLKQNLSALTVHLRTVSELSKDSAHWEHMNDIVKLRNKISPQTFIIGNGGIRSLSEVIHKHTLYRNDGFMIGTGIFANPWIFDPNKKLENVTVSERVEMYKNHIKLFGEVWKNKKNSAIIKKFCKMYINGFAGASEFRERLMRTDTLEELLGALESF